MIQMEVCANSLSSAMEAQRGGATRVELCDNLPEGGTTPSYAQIKLAKQLLNIHVYPIIRPRGGDFLYSELEFEIMKVDIEVCKSLDCDGIVMGILQSDGSVDKKRCAILIELARPLPVTFHRAFDSSNDLVKAMEDIIDLGCERILTSGAKDAALQGVKKIKELIEIAAGRIIIMPGAGINESNITEIICNTGAREFHASAKNAVNSQMQFRNAKVTMGSIENEFNYELTNCNTVKNLIQLANRSIKR